MSLIIDHLDQLASFENEPSAASRPMDIWVPGEEVSVYEVEMPDVPQRKWLDMVPWLLEDQLLRPAEELHFVLGPQLADKKTLVYVVAKEAMNRWTMMAESKSVSAQKLAPDYLALPIEDDYWTMSIVGSRMLVRTGNYTGFSADAAFGWQLLELELNKAEAVRIAALVDDETVIPNQWRDRVQAQQGTVNWSFIDLPEINLLCGDYRPKKATELAPWLPSIGLAACATFLLLIFMLVQSSQWQKDIVVIDAGIAEAYQDLFSEAWRGSQSGVRSAAEERIRLLEHQFIALQSTPLYELRSIDTGLSACADCDVQLIEQEDGFVSLTMKPADNLRSRLGALSGLDLEWGSPDEEGVLSLKVSRGSDDG